MENCGEGASCSPQDLATAISEALQFDEAHGMGGNEALWPPALAATKKCGAVRIKRKKQTKAERDASYIESIGGIAIVTSDETAMEPAEPPSGFHVGLLALHVGCHQSSDDDEDPDFHQWLERSEKRLAGDNPGKVTNRRLPNDHPILLKRRETKVSERRQQFEARVYAPKDKKYTYDHACVERRAAAFTTNMLTKCGCG